MLCDPVDGGSMSAQGFLTLGTPGRPGPQHHPPIHNPCTTTLFSTTSPINIFLSPPWGFCQLGICDSPYSIGECSEKAAPFLNMVIRCRDRV
jgi:hypothetical protein